MILLLLAALLLPFALSRDYLQSLPTQTDPTFWLLGILIPVVGLPFFFVSTNSPLLQKWFSLTRHPKARDPYFLFAAGNLGSFAALLGFPLVLEPNFSLDKQCELWALGFLALAILMGMCVFVVWRTVAISQEATDQSLLVQESKEGIGAGMTQRLDVRRRLLWVALSFVPSSLVLGVTAHISTDIAAVPLLWVIPLALYLLSFVLVFSRKQVIRHRWIGRLFPGAALILTFVYLSGALEPAWFLISLHLVFFFMAAMVCHGRLADDRPTVCHLVEYYLCIALGGMLGGLFNALIVPNIFDSIVEYPLALVLACLMLSEQEDGRDSPWKGRLDVAVPILIGVATIVLARLAPHWEMSTVEELATVFGIPIMATYLARHRPFRLGLAVGAIMLGSHFYPGHHGELLHQERNFFGVLRVSISPSGNIRQLYHGNTVHGKQFVSQERQCEPLGYYHRQGPLGDIFKIYDSGMPKSAVAGIGLGTGAMACYGSPDQEWTFYEINPAVLRLARDEDYFTYLTKCKKQAIRVVLGDARLKLEAAPDGRYGLIVLDAFSSDAIPVHLITEEAIHLYLTKLAPGGILGFHISNRNLNLQLVLAGALKNNNLIGYVADDRESDAVNGKDPSLWVVMARENAALGILEENHRWIPMGQESPSVTWTDDFSDIMSVFKWF